MNNYNKDNFKQAYKFDEPLDEDDIITGFCPHCHTMTDPWNVYFFMGKPRCYSCTPIWFIYLTNKKVRREKLKRIWNNITVFFGGKKLNPWEY